MWSFGAPSGGLPGSSLGGPSGGLLPLGGPLPSGGPSLFDHEHLVRYVKWHIYHT